MWANGEANTKNLSIYLYFLNHNGWMQKSLALGMLSSLGLDLFLFIFYEFLK